MQFAYNQKLNCQVIEFETQSGTRDTVVPNQVTKPTMTFLHKIPCNE